LAQIPRSFPAAVENNFQKISRSIPADLKVISKSNVADLNTRNIVSSTVETINTLPKAHLLGTFRQQFSINFEIKASPSTLFIWEETQAAISGGVSSKEGCCHEGHKQKSRVLISRGIFNKV
jgi:hypothetical protein